MLGAIMLFGYLVPDISPPPKKTAHVTVSHGHVIVTLVQ